MKATEGHAPACSPSLTLHNRPGTLKRGAQWCILNSPANRSESAQEGPDINVPRQHCCFDGYTQSNRSTPFIMRSKRWAFGIL